MLRAAVLAVAVAVALTGSSSGVGGAAHRAPGPGVPSAPPARAVRYTAPVLPVRVVRPFAPPTSPYGPGHRGVDLATSSSHLVGAAGDGVVRFAGTVAGRGVVVLVHADGVLTEYEPVRPLVRRGAAVLRGDPIGRITGTHGSCRPGGCLHWGARRDGAYFDPLTLLHPLGPVRLLPDGP